MKSVSLGRKTAVRFMLVSLGFLLLGCMEGLMHPTKFAFKEFYAHVFGVDIQYIKPFFGYFVTKIHAHITLVGWVTSAIMGMFYYAAGEIKEGDRYCSWVCHANLIFQILGVLTLALGWHLIGVVSLPTGYEAGSPEFRAAARSVKPLVVIGGTMLLISCLLFVYNIGATLLMGPREKSPTIDPKVSV